MIRRHGSVIAAGLADLDRVRHVDAPTPAILRHGGPRRNRQPLDRDARSFSDTSRPQRAGACGRTGHATPPERRRAPVIVGFKKYPPGSRKLRSRHHKDRSMKGCPMQRAIFLFGAVFALGSSVAASAQTLKAVKDRGSLICGVGQGVAGFSLPDDKGNWTGFDVDFCRAIAAAVLNDSTKVKFTPLSAKDRFEPLKTGDIDVLSRNTTWTLSRDVAY